MYFLSQSSLVLNLVLSIFLKIKKYSLRSTPKRFTGWIGRIVGDILRFMLGSWLMKKVAYLGLGAWGYCLASLLAGTGRMSVVGWTTDPQLAADLQAGGYHPRLSGFPMPKNMRVTTDLQEALQGADLLVESVTSKGLRPVLEQVRSIQEKKASLHQTPPLILTSKGIEQETLLTLPEVALEVLGKDKSPPIGLLSGPSFADDVIRQLPTSVVATGYNTAVIDTILSTFTTPFFRVYPNADWLGVALGGALKNVIAIACGVAEGLALGESARAALMTRGLHEMRKLAVACGAESQTLNGLSGMGDLCATCQSTLSRNFRFGKLLADRLSAKEAQAKIGMVVEGANTCHAALALGRKKGVVLPIAEAVEAIMDLRLDPREAVRQLMRRSVKDEHL